MTPEDIAFWWKDCLYWRGRVLMGRYTHWCADYDDLPVDETCSEWPCLCATVWATQREVAVEDRSEDR